MPTCLTVVCFKRVDTITLCKTC
ncbi:hypothetical protein F383_09450 [Gossypium arboreum]|uniref:Uncharacterized protein n=1 Tax=Gossypium arboreum TaxID=29729 RepID=A0A0B0P4W5_GOSAR|nr:hypothetical protein F383_09450 [Gossypium arboreum]